MPAAKPKTPKTKQPKSIASIQSFSSSVKAACDIMRRSNCASALQYVPELTWILFLRILDLQDREAQAIAMMNGETTIPALPSPYRWCDWAAPYSDKPGHPQTPEGKPEGWKRNELFAAGDGKLFAFINTELLPFLHAFATAPTANTRQRVIGQIMTSVERVRVDSEGNLGDVLDRVHDIHPAHIDDTHFFTLSQVYEDLLLKMGEKNSDGGQFFTPREIIRGMVRTLEPRLGETIYDPCCGTGGFLAQTYEYMAQQLGENPSSTDLETLKTQTFYGREKENLVYPIALANLVLHGIDQPNIWHGNTLTKTATYDDLFADAPEKFDVILTNPPFGGKEGKTAQSNFNFETSATQVLFLQRVLDELADDGSCGIVLDEGLLFRTNESAFVETKRKLVDECDLWCIVSLPGGVFSTAGAGVKTNLLFFTKGAKTSKIWYYDLSWVKVGKKTPLTLAHFGFSTHGILEDAALPATLTSDWQAQAENAGKPFPSFARLKSDMGTAQADSAFSWTVDFAERRAQAQVDMEPFKQQETALKETLITLKEQQSALRKASPRDDNALAECQTSILETEKAVRDAKAKADAIDAAVFDLKAVNAHIKAETDERSVLEVLDGIQQRGKAIDTALNTLRQLILQP